jgi:acetolactate synthase-1/2/3 large subunit
VGGGAFAPAPREIRAFAEAANVPVVTTLMARGAFPTTTLSLGMPGMHGTYTATTAIQRSDVLMLSARFDDRAPGKSMPSPLMGVIHVDVDPAEIGKGATRRS